MSFLRKKDINKEISERVDLFIKDLIKGVKPILQKNNDVIQVSFENFTRTKRLRCYRLIKAPRYIQIV